MEARPGDGFKLDRLAEDPAQCFVLLDAAGGRYTRVDRGGLQAEYGLFDVFALDRSPTPYSGTLSMSCSLAASLHMRERHVVIHAAERNLGQSVSCIETMSAYSCRHVNSARAARWRKHANGEAVNIAGFQLANGTEVMVKDELGKDTSRGRFLKEMREEACGLFSTTLSPDYNKLHADHLLFDMGFATSCS